MSSGLRLWISVESRECEALGRAPQAGPLTGMRDGGARRHGLSIRRCGDDFDLVVARQVGEGLAAHDGAQGDAAVVERSFVDRAVRFDERDQLAVGQVGGEGYVDL